MVFGLARASRLARARLRVGVRAATGGGTRGGPAVSAPGTNPILDRLRSFGQTRGLAFGAYGEASPDVHALLTVAADGLAARQWRD